MVGEKAGSVTDPNPPGVTPLCPSIGGIFVQLSTEFYANLREERPSCQQKWEESATMRAQRESEASAARLHRGAPMGSSRSFTVRTRAYEQEWADAALVEQVELLEAQLPSLETERSRLETELSIAQSWVKELALWLDEAQLPTGAKPVPGAPGEDLEEMLLSPSTARLLEEAEAVPIAWGTIALLTGFVLAPWAVLGSLVYLAW